MGKVVIETKKRDIVHSLTAFLAGALGLMTLTIVFMSHGNPTITGATVFRQVYGAASPFVILVILLVVIYLYAKLR